MGLQEGLKIVMFLKMKKQTFIYGELKQILTLLGAQYTKVKKWGFVYGKAQWE